jgi:hypothetical protein
MTSKSFVKESIHSETKFGWQDQFKSVIHSKFDYGLVTIMTRTGTGKSFIAPKNLDVDSQKYNKTFIYVPNNQKNLIQEHENAIEHVCSESNTTYTKISKEKSTLYRINISDEKVYHYEILTFVPSASSISKVLRHNKDILYFDEEHTYQTQFGFVHAGNKYQHSKQKLENIFSSFKKEKNDGNNFFSNIIDLTSRNKVVFVSATLDDNFINDLFPFTTKINIMNVIVKHKKEHFPHIPITYYKNQQGIIEKMIEKYYKWEKSYIYVSNILSLKKLFQILTQSINQDDIYFWHSKQKKSFSAERARETKVCIFINKGTTGINDLNLKNIFIFRNLSAKSTSSRDMDNKDVSNICLQIMGRLRCDGNVYWYGEKVNENSKNSNLFDLTESYYRYALSEKVNKIHLFGLHIIKKQYSSDFENYFIRPFIFAYIWQKQWSQTNRSDENSVLSVMNTYKKECSKLYRKMENCVFKEIIDETVGKKYFQFVNADTGRKFYFDSEYLYLEERMMKSYKEIICESYSHDYENFFL